MAVLQMQKVSICALKKDRKAILEKIQSMGVMEISKVLDDDSGFERMNTQNERSKFEKKRFFSGYGFGYSSGIRAGKGVYVLKSGRQKADRTAGA